jgi:hypothetical protein
MTVAELNYGEVFTRRWVVDTLLDLTGYRTDVDLGAISVIEPSCGSGAFLGPLVERLIASAGVFGRDLITLSDAVRAYDLQAEHVQTSRSQVRSLLTGAGADVSTAAALAATWVRHADFLLDPIDRPADVVIGNPPYIRYDDIPAETAVAYRQTWSTMRGRGDIYVGFIERSLAMLKPGGQVGFICADRWMRNQYGAALRELVSSKYAVQHVWTMHDVDAFEAQVSAYPAITVIGNREQGSVVLADTSADFGAAQAQALDKWSQDPALTEFQDQGVKAHRLPHWFDGDTLWPSGSPARLALIEQLNNQCRPLHDPATGTKVSIGIATGADKVYITKDPTVVEADRLLPLAMRRDLMSGTFEWQGNYLVNPWAEDGSLVDLADYPLLAAYLGSHPVLRERFVAKKNPNGWHRTIDKVHASLTATPKLLLQDMKATIHPVLERGGYYPHHNLYYVTSDTWDLEVLGGLLLSRVAQAFIEAYCVRMRGGTLRFQSQYLKRIRVPAPQSIDADVAVALRVAFLSRDVDAATAAAGLAYGVDLADYDLATLA